MDAVGKDPDDLVASAEALPSDQPAGRLDESGDVDRHRRRINDRLGRMDQVLIGRRLTGAEGNALPVADHLDATGEILAPPEITEPLARAGGDLV